MIETNEDASARNVMFLLRTDSLPCELKAAVTHRELMTGQVLYHRGDPATAVFAVERGRLQLFSYTTEGKPVPLYVIRGGECVSEAALFAETYCGDVVAEAASRVLVFPKPALLSVFAQHPALSNEFMTALTKRFNMLRIRLELRNLQSARERILQYLMATAAPGQKSVALDRPLKSIADDLGLTHECFYRVFAQLVKDGAVVRRRGSIAFQLPGGRDPDHGTSRGSGVFNKCELEYTKADAGLSKSALQ
ncbi:MAG: Crp/Fnr family transcriptional regulator [Acidobacteriota bacterium]|nr:Crp/Fnr family transcriptional regulator [Acidobacteriota bacterium]